MRPNNRPPSSTPRYPRVLKVAAVAAAMLQSAPVASQQPTLIQRMDALFASVNSDSTPGCAVGIARGTDAPVYRTYGLENLEQRLPIDTLTVFEAGSVSKQITAAAVLLLAQEGRLSLSDPVRKWVPELWSGLPPFTVGDMLHHVSGLRDYGDLLELSGWPRGSRTTDNADALRLLGLQRSLNFAPRAEYAYSNSNYLLASIIVARASGVSFGAFTQRAIFAPLGMTHTSWRDDYTRIVPRRAQGYTPNDSSRWMLDMPFENSVGHGGLLTTVADLLRWQRRFLAPAALVDTAIGGRNFVRDMEEQVTLTTGRRSGYALGLEIDTMSGERVVTHGGWTAGYKAYVGRVPAQGVGVALLCNAGSLNTEEVGAAVLAVASGLAIPNLYVEPRLGAPADSADPRSLARLAGSYRSERTRQPVRVRAYADGLTMNSWTGYRRGADSTFVSLDGTRTIRFLHDARGTPMGYRVNQGADTVRYARVSAWTPSATELRSAVGRFRCTEADADVEIIADAAGLSFRRRGRLLNALRPRYRDAFDMPDLGWLLNIRRSPASRVTGIDLGISRTRTLPCERVT